MEVGQVIGVYQDARTKQRFEGDARLVELLVINSSREECYEYWLVEFLDEPGVTFPRLIGGIK